MQFKVVRSFCLNTRSALRWIQEMLSSEEILSNEPFHSSEHWLNASFSDAWSCFSLHFWFLHCLQIATHINPEFCHHPVDNWPCVHSLFCNALIESSVKPRDSHAWLNSWDLIFFTTVYVSLRVLHTFSGTKLLAMWIFGGWASIISNGIHICPEGFSLTVTDMIRS